MRTTVRLRDELLERAKRHAAQEGRTLTSLIEEGLVLVLEEKAPESRQEVIELPVSRARGGIVAGVDLNDSRDLRERMNGT